MNIGLFLTIREFRKLAGDTSGKAGADTDLPLSHGQKIELDKISKW